jgi:hypothetical protein
MKNWETKCNWCGTWFILPTKIAKDYYRISGKAYCTKKCGRSALRKSSSETMSRTNRKYASERMRRKNPMFSPACREKVSLTLKRMNWRPKVQGGNGRSLPVPQALLAAALGWQTEWSVPTGRDYFHGNGDGLASVYKIDVAEPYLKIAIEVDGRGHNRAKIRKQDQKKEHFLVGKGWTMLRFSNQQVMENLNECVQTVMSTISKLKETTLT